MPDLKMGDFNARPDSQANRHRATANSYARTHGEETAAVPTPSDEYLKEGASISDTHPALEAMKRLEAERSLAPAVTALDRMTTAVLGTGRRRRLFEGRWLGHTFHGLLTDFVEGPWMAATFLDLFGPQGSSNSARRLLGLGLAAVPLAHLSGLADWQQAEDEGARRVGMVHALTASAATALYAGSYLARRGGYETGARALGLAGGVTALLDGYLGGHLSHVRAVAVGEQA